MHLTGVCQQAKDCPHPLYIVVFLDGIMEKKASSSWQMFSFHENGRQLLCGLGLISVHAIALLAALWFKDLLSIFAKLTRKNVMKFIYHNQLVTTRIFLA